MRFKATLAKALLCLFVCRCNGIPPKQTTEKSSNWSKYTDEEDMFIVEELSNLLKSNSRVHSRCVWKTIQEKHALKLKANSQGFSTARTAEGLRHRFRNTLVYNHPDTTVKVPETLLWLVNKGKYNAEESHDNEQSYTKQENDFLFEELLKPTCVSMTSTRALEPICIMHDRKRQDETPGFEFARNAQGLRLHLLRLKRKGLFPLEVTEKFRKHRKGGSSSKSSTHELDLQESDDHEWGAETSHALNTYSNQEDKFIAETLISLLDNDAHVFSGSVWEKIHEKHAEKVKSGASGFSIGRTANALRHRFRSSLVSNFPDVDVEVPESLQRKIQEANDYKRGEGREPKQWYSKEENKLIFEELLKPSCLSMTSTRGLQPICEKHDRKRLAKTPGFESERTAAGLRLHLVRLRRKGKLPPKVTEKFQKLKQGKKSKSLSQETDTQESDDDEWATKMIESLRDDPDA